MDPDGSARGDRSGADRRRLTSLINEPDDSVASFRAGSGTPLVLLHPALTSWRVWRPVLPRLVPHHDVVALTMAGHRGGPDRAAGQRLTLAMITDHVERELDAMGIGTAHFVGNSLGGRISLELVGRGRARSVTAISPPGAWRHHGDGVRVVGLLSTLQRLVARPGVVQLARPLRVRRAVLRAGMEHGERVPLADIAVLCRDVRHAKILGDLWQDIQTVGMVDLPDLAGVPVLIAWAEHDRVVPYEKFAIPLMPLIPEAEFRVLPGVGHVPMWDAPDLVASTILEITRKAEAAAPIAPEG
jgi:pimeloyl-ACP methyl ester carboxylesterase